MDLIIFIVVVAVMFGVTLAVISRRLQSLTKNEDSQSFLMLHQTIQGMHQRLDETSKNLQDRFDRQSQTMQQSIQTQIGESTKIVRDVTERLTKLDETNKQVVSFADQLQQLQDILKNPKQRGMLGEYQLEQLLKQAFNAKQYQMQYKFKDGVIADAVLFFGDKLIPIDSKFSLENYNRIVEERDPNRRSELEELFRRDLKNRIDETSKYIRPQEDTLDFAFMFIPAEGIYYDLLINKVGAVKVNTRDLLDYAIHDKRVHIVSPTTFYVTLQALMVGMNAYKIQESTKMIVQNVGVLGKHLHAYEEYFKRLGNNLSTTVNAYNLASKELAKIDKDVVKLSGGEKQIEALALERPDTE